MLTMLLLASTALAGPHAVDTYFGDIWSQGDFTALDQVVTADFVGQTVAAGQSPVEGREGLQAWVSAVRKALPGTKSVESIVQTGAQVVVHVHLSAPHPSGKGTVEADQVHWLTLDDGKIAEDRVYFDLGTVMGQLK